MKDLNVKDIRKAAFAVGLGFTVGKQIGEMVNAAINGAWLGTLKSLAEHGNKIAQETCERNNIKYDKGERKENSDEIKMGFHV